MTKEFVFLDSDGATQITDEDLGLIAANTTSDPKKLYVRNTGDEALGSSFNVAREQAAGSEGWTMAQVAADGATLSRVYGVTGEVAADAGTWGGVGLVGCVIVAKNATGKAMASEEVTKRITTTSQKITWAWTTQAGVTHYEVHRTTTPGDYSGATLIGTVAHPGNQLVDTGATPTTLALPTENDSGGASPDFGSPSGLFGLGPLVLGPLAAGQERPFWLRGNVPTGTLDDSNPEQFNLIFAE